MVDAVCADENEGAHLAPCLVKFFFGQRSSATHWVVAKSTFSILFWVLGQRRRKLQRKRFLGHIIPNVSFITVSDDVGGCWFHFQHLNPQLLGRKKSIGWRKKQKRSRRVLLGRKSGQFLFYCGGYGKSELLYTWVLVAGLNFWNWFCLWQTGSKEGTGKENRGIKKPPGGRFTGLITWARKINWSKDIIRCIPPITERIIYVYI